MTSCELSLLEVSIDCVIVFSYTLDILYAFMHDQTLSLLYGDFYLAIGSITQQLIYQSDEEKKYLKKR